jgi:hypothetical protein
MTTKKICNEIMNIVSQHTGDERDLLEELESIAEGWKMRLEELDEED